MMAVVAEIARNVFVRFWMMRCWLAIAMSVPSSVVQIKMRRTGVAEANSAP